MTDPAVIVIGAGAAGIAAARHLQAAGLAVVVLEARDRVGGRAWTVLAGGLPLDLGCGWLHSADENDWARIAKAEGLAIDPLPPPWARPAHPAGFPPADQRAFRAAWEALYARVDAADAAGQDGPMGDLLEPGGRWNPLLGAMASYINGAELAKLSVRDYARYHDTRVNWRVVAGYGALVARHAAGLDVRLGCAATRIDHSGRRLRVATAHGELAAGAVIVTVPPTLIAAEALRFTPTLPEKLAAAQALPLGTADKVFLGVDAPDDLPVETRLFGATDTVATGSYHLRPFGRPVIEGYFGGDFARSLEAEGPGAFADFAIGQIAERLGSAMRQRLHPLAESAWARDPFARGAYSYGQPGAGEARRALATPVDGRLFFAGEACSAQDFSTAHGAFRTGVAAAEGVLRARVAGSNRLSL